MATSTPLQPALIKESATEDFLLLEAKIARVGDALRQARAARHRAEAEAAQAKAAYEELKQIYALTEQDVAALRQEREATRQRVGQLLEQLDHLAPEESEA